MHTTEFKKFDVTFIHNGDFSGDVIIVRGDGEETFEVPFAALVSIVAAWARDVKIAKLEGANERKVLGLPP